MTSDQICIGKITRPHGVRGLVKVKSFVDDERLLEQSEPSLTLKSSAGDTWIAAIQDVDNRNEAEAYRGRELYLDRGLLPDLPDGQTYHVDLIGLQAVTPKHKLLGKVINVANFGAGDLLEVQPEGGQSFYVVFNDDNVYEILLEKGVIVIEPPVMV